jgi:hypothetical protein
LVNGYLQKYFEKLALVTYLISDGNMGQLDLFVKTLQLKAYSVDTIRLYKNEMMILMRLLKKEMSIKMYDLCIF